MYQYFLFDLDGTITDSKVGITKSVQYALRHFGIEEPDLNKLEVFIGPPLKDSFMRYYGLPEEQAVSAISVYREYYAVTGIYENRVYEGIPELLRKAKEQGKTLIVASSKPEEYVRRILEYFHLADLFDEIVGATMDEKRCEKEEVIREVFDRMHCDGTDRSQWIMIGDRSHDVIGAAKCGIDCLGTYIGFAVPGELEEAGAKWIAHSVAEMEEILLGR